MGVRLYLRIVGSNKSRRAQSQRLSSPIITGFNVRQCIQLHSMLGNALQICRELSLLLVSRLLKLSSSSRERDTACPVDAYYHRHHQRSLFN